MPDDNPLAIGSFCRVCGCRKDSAERECPMGCTAALYFVTRMFRGQAFRGVAVVEAVAANA